MEHNPWPPTDARRGAGLGFHLPYQIQRLEPIVFQDIVQGSARATRNNTPFADDLDCSMHEIWIKHMINRFFLLYQQSASGNASSFSELRTTLTKEDELRLNPTSQDAFKAQLREKVRTTSTPFPRRNGLSQGRTSTLIPAFITGLPKTTDEVVFLWRYGSRDAMFKPVRLFEDAENRKRLVVSYSPSL